MVGGGEGPAFWYVALLRVGTFHLVGQNVARNSFNKRKPATTLLQFAGKVLQTERPKKGRFWIRNNSVKNQVDIFKIEEVMVELIFIVDGKTLNCCNFLNIDPYDLIFQNESQCVFVFVHN